MSAYYPVMLNLAGKRCVVIGGGWGTAERVKTLAAAGAYVTLICEATVDFGSARVLHIRRGYQPGDLEGAFIAMACPPDRAHNAAIWAEAEARNIPVNCVDDTAHCTFIFPAVHRQGDLVVAVSSSGKSPALAARIRDRIAAGLGPEYGALLNLLGEVRAEVIRRFPGFKRRREIWHGLIDSGALEHLKSGEPDAARESLRRILDGHAAE